MTEDISSFGNVKAFGQVRVIRFYFLMFCYQIGISAWNNKFYFTYLSEWLKLTCEECSEFLIMLEVFQK